MRIAIDIKPLSSQDRYRGVGAYTRNLVEAVHKYDQENTYIEVTPDYPVNKEFDLLIIPYFSPFQLTLPPHKITKTLVTVHDLIPLKYKENFPIGVTGNLVWQYQRFRLSNVEGILTDSQVSAKDIAKIGGIDKEKISVVYPSFNELFTQIKDSRFFKKTKIKYPVLEKFILYVGDCNWNKNVPTLIKAAQLLKYNLVLVGKVFRGKVDPDHPWNQAIKEVRQLLKDDLNTFVYGFVSKKDLVALYNLATVCVQPSFDEGFGLPIIEAFACGCPVIASDNPVFREIAEDAVIYFDPRNVNQLAQKIKQVYENPDLANKFRDKGLAQAQKYTQKQFIKSLKNVYQKIFK